MLRCSPDAYKTTPAPADAHAYGRSVEARKHSIGQVLADPKREEAARRGLRTKFGETTSASEAPGANARPSQYRAPCSQILRRGERSRTSGRIMLQRHQGATNRQSCEAFPQMSRAPARSRRSQRRSSQAHQPAPDAGAGGHHPHHPSAHTALGEAAASEGYRRRRTSLEVLPLPL